MGKTSSKVKERYNAKAYDDMRIRIPKGQKATIEAFAKEHDTTINKLTECALLAYMGLESWPAIENKEE